jgi:hypothetical protein
MKKTSLLLIFAASLIFSSCSKSEDVAPATVVGKWNFDGFGAILDSKTFDATPTELKKSASINAAGIDQLASENAFEFKADNTYIAGTDNGTYKTSADNKSITMTSKVEKDSKGAFDVQTYEIKALTASSFKMALPKLTKDAKGTLIGDGTLNDFVSALLGSIVLEVKATKADFDATKTLQITINLKK